MEQKYGTILTEQRVKVCSSGLTCLSTKHITELLKTDIVTELEQKGDSTWITFRVLDYELILKHRKRW